MINNEMQNRIFSFEVERDLMNRQLLALIDLLVSKGIITEADAQSIKNK